MNTMSTMTTNQGSKTWASLVALVFGLGLLPSHTTAADNRSPGPLEEQPGWVKSEFIANQLPTPSGHASTIVETQEGLAAAWFGGTEEKNPDVGIWLATHDGRQWSVPKEVANGLQADGTRHPCWNPVLFQPNHGPLLLFYKAGPSPSKWWGMLMKSATAGKTWSTPQRLPDGILGPVRNKPVTMAKGGILCGSSTEDNGWMVHMELTTDLGTTWKRSESLNKRAEFGAIQPTILCWPAGGTQILNRSRQGAITECWAIDNWQAWSPMHRTTLPNPNSGIDAVMLQDGRGLLVYNHTRQGRSPLNVSVSKDGYYWQAALVLENQPGEYSYPAVIQTEDGLVHITYTWKRLLIKHVTINPSRLQPRNFDSGKWPQ